MRRPCLVLVLLATLALATCGTTIRADDAEPDKRAYSGSSGST